MNFSIENEEKFINVNPSKQDVKEVLDWLKEEMDHNGRSFYCNKNIIESAFEEEKSIVFRYKEKNVGLVIWSNYDDFRVDIDIFVIHPSYRNQGLGSFFYNAILIFFRNKGFKTLKLFCEPKNSEVFWKKMGLTKLPECGRTEPDLTYYMILVETASIKSMEAMDKIELWDVESYEAKTKKPKWTWYVKIKDGVLLYPIIHPCNPDWNMCWSRNGQIIKQEKVKRFTREDFELYCYPFLYIVELKK